MKYNLKEKYRNDLISSDDSFTERENNVVHNTGNTRDISRQGKHIQSANTMLVAKSDFREIYEDSTTFDN